MFGRLTYSMQRVSGGIDITELRAGAQITEYIPWGGATSESIRIFRIRFALRRGGITFTAEPKGAVSCNALARRIGRAVPNDDDTLLADIAALAGQPCELPRVPVPDKGRSVG